MELRTRTLGRRGPVVTTVGLGCNNFGREGTLTETQAGTTAVIDAALELGVTLLDTADMYGGHPGQSETLMGVALEGRRDSIVLATKFGHEAVDMRIADAAAKGSRAYIRAAITDSLGRLRTDRVDLYQLHHPDPGTPIEETILALEELVAEGKILHYGHSNLSASQLVEAQAVADRLGVTGFTSAQNEYSLIAREVEREVLPTVVELGLGFLPYFPLANGLFTGKFSRTERPADTRIMRQRPHIVQNAPWDAMEAYAAFCTERGVTMLEATFGWFLAQSAVTSVIAGATTPGQLEQNAAASVAWSPTEADVRTISNLFDYS